MADWDKELKKVHEIERLLARAGDLAIPKSPIATEHDGYKELAFEIRRAQKKASGMVDRLAGQAYRYLRRTTQQGDERRGL